MTIQDVSPGKLHLHPRSITSWLKELFGEGIFNVHHECYPKRSYSKKVASEYRNLPCKQVVMRTDQHKDWHHSGLLEPTEPPSASEMSQQIADCRARGCPAGSCVMPIQVCMTDVPIELAMHPNVELVPPPL